MGEEEAIWVVEVVSVKECIILNIKVDVNFNRIRVVVISPLI